MTDDEFEKRLLDDTLSIRTRIRTIIFFLFVFALFNFTKILSWNWGWNHQLLESRQVACHLLFRRMYDRAPELRKLRNPVYSDSIHQNSTVTQLRLRKLEDDQYSDSTRYALYMDQVQSISRLAATSVEGIPLVPTFNIPTNDLPIAMAIALMGAGALLWMHALELEANVKKWNRYLRNVPHGKIQELVLNTVQNTGIYWNPKKSPPLLYLMFASSAGALATADITCSYSFIHSYINDPVFRQSLSKFGITVFFYREGLLLACAAGFGFLCVAIPNRISRLVSKLEKVN